MVMWRTNGWTTTSQYARAKSTIAAAQNAPREPPRRAAAARHHRRRAVGAAAGVVGDAAEAARRELSHGSRWQWQLAELASHTAPPLRARGVAITVAFVGQLGGRSL